MELYPVVNKSGKSHGHAPATETIVRIAALQMNSTRDWSANLAQAHELIREANSKGAFVVALPENFALFCEDRQDFLEQSHAHSKVFVETLQEWAVEFDLWIVGGSLPIPAAKASKGSKKLPHVFNSSLLINPDGKIVARYDKIHLFDVDLKGDRKYHESDSIKPGTTPVFKKTPWGNVGLSICYDVRFPELFRAYADQKADLLFLPAAFTAFTGKAHWDVLTRARAIESQAYLIAPAQTGSAYPGQETHGHTRIVDPWGRVIAERAGGVGVVWADLSSKETDRVRGELPSLKNRKKIKGKKWL